MQRTLVACSTQWSTRGLRRSAAPPAQRLGCRDIYRDTAGILWLAPWSEFARLDPASGTITAYRVNMLLGNEKVHQPIAIDNSPITLYISYSLVHLQPSEHTP